MAAALPPFDCYRRLKALFRLRFSLEPKGALSALWKTTTPSTRPLLGSIQSAFLRRVCRTREHVHSTGSHVSQASEATASASAGCISLTVGPPPAWAAPGLSFYEEARPQLKRGHGGIIGSGSLHAHAHVHMHMHMCMCMHMYGNRP